MAEHEAENAQPSEPLCEGLAPFACGNPSCPAHGSPADCGGTPDWCLADNGVECANHNENGDRHV